MNKRFEGYAFMQLLRKTQSQFSRLDQQQIFFRQTYNLKFFFVNSNSNNFIRVQENYFFEFKFEFETLLIFILKLD